MVYPMVYPKLTVLSIGKCNIGNALIIRNKERHYKCKTPTLGMGHAPLGVICYWGLR